MGDLPCRQVGRVIESPRLRILHRGDPVVDEPIVRPSDTWFGPNTQAGELCYAARMTARLHLENVSVQPGRAISAVHVHNRSTSALDVHRIKIPVESLSLFASADGHLWTESLSLERSASSNDATVRLESRPEDPSASRQVSAPRSAHVKSVFDVFGGIFTRDAEAVP